MLSTVWMAVSLGLFVASSAQGQAEAPGVETSDKAYVLDHRVETIDGEEVDLRAYEGRVVMIVNVASRCGLTPQYEGLQELYDRYWREGFVVLGFPANDFAGQEPGTNKEIKAFCTGEYDVTFPMMAKVKVLGEDRHPLYDDLVGQREPVGGDPKWNFTKYLLNRRGEVVARFEPRTKPDDEKVVETISELLLDKQLRDGAAPWEPPAAPAGQ